MKMALGKKSVELEEKQRECDMHLASTIKLEGQVEAYKFCIEHWGDRRGHVVICAEGFLKRNLM